jgi:hypothetical protein
MRCSIAQTKVVLVLSVNSIHPQDLDYTIAPLPKSNERYYLLVRLELGEHVRGLSGESLRPIDTASSANLLSYPLLDPLVDELTAILDRSWSADGSLGYGLI